MFPIVLVVGREFWRNVMLTSLAGKTVIVTGATGGVGSLAINMLAGRGYEVVALSGKPGADDYLREIAFRIEEAGDPAS